MLILDDSEWMRNGDFLPTRLVSQSEAAYQLAQMKLDDNPESSVGAMTMGNGGKVLLSLNRDIGDLLTATNALQPSGSSDLISALSIAQLVLKNRRNKRGGQRIVIFVGSPLAASERELVRVGRLLKRNNIAVDVINFGEALENAKKLEAFVDSVKKESRPCHLVTVPTGSSNDLSAILIGTPIFSLEGGPGGSSSSHSGSAALEDDPELAEAIRMSQAASGIPATPDNDQDAIRQALLLSQQEEEEALQQALLLSTQESSTTTTSPAPIPSTPIAADPTTPAVAEDDEAALLEMAMMMSQEIPASNPPPSNPPPSNPPSFAPSSIPAPSLTASLDDDDFGGDAVADLDAELMAAIQMSLGADAIAPSSGTQSGSQPSAAATASLADDPSSEAFSDPSLRDVLNSVLDEIGGIDKDDPDIQRELNKLTGDDKQKDLKDDPQ